MFNVDPKISTKTISRKILSVSDMKLKNNGHIVAQEILNKRGIFLNAHLIIN